MSLGAQGPWCQHISPQFDRILFVNSSIHTPIQYHVIM